MRQGNSRRMNQLCIGSKEPNNSHAAAGERDVRASSAREGLAEKQAVLLPDNKKRNYSNCKSNQFIG